MTELSVLRHASEMLRPSAPSSLAELRASFYEASLREELLVGVAGSMQDEIDYCLDADTLREPRLLEEGEFTSLYDPSLPTIAFDVHQMFAGAELLGVVAHEAATRVNIIYTSALTGDAVAKISDDASQAHLEVAGGALVLPSGQVVYGTFPSPVIADRLETVDIKLIEQCETFGLPVAHSSTRMRELSDKSQLDRLSHNRHAYTPRQIARVAFLGATQTDNLVIKPMKQSQGRGVLLTDVNADSQHAKHFYTFLEDHRYEPIVQERARSTPIVDPETQQRLDWNVRALVSYGELIGMYVRADIWGVPVNISQSARAIHMDDFVNYFEDPADATQVVETLHAAARAVATEVSDVGIVGLDLTVDESMRVCMFEMNCGNVGGLQTMARLEKTPDSKLAMSRHLLAKHIAKTELHRPQDADAATVKLDVMLDTLVLGANFTSLKRALGDMDVNELPINDEERFGRVHALALMHARAAGTFQHERSAEINRILQSDYPLELRRYILTTHSDPMHGEAVDSYLDTYSSLYPEDMQVRLLRADQLLAEINLPAYRMRILEAPNSAELEQASLEILAKRTLFRWFGELPKQLTEEEDDLFVALTKQAISRYCHDGYEAAIRDLAEHLECGNMSESYAELVGSLQFCIAMSDERRDDALKFFAACEERSRDPWRFYENVVDQFCHAPRRGLDSLSDERLIMRAAVDAQINPPLIVMIDTLEYLRQSERNTEVRHSIVDMLATYLPFDWSDDAREMLRQVLIDLVSDTDNHTSILSSETYEASLPVATKVMLLIDRLIRGEVEAALVLFDDLATEQDLENDLDYLRDAYVDGNQ
jgi:glutathione synthase/RimK-type ligase-like ATP-grasp enzyme